MEGSPFPPSTPGPGLSAPVSDSGPALSLGRGAPSLTLTLPWARQPLARP